MTEALFSILFFLATLNRKKTTIVIGMSTRAYIQGLSSIGPILVKIFEVVERGAPVELRGQDREPLGDDLDDELPHEGEPKRGFCNVKPGSMNASVLCVIFAAIQRCGHRVDDDPPMTLTSSTSWKMVCAAQSVRLAIRRCACHLRVVREGWSQMKSALMCY
ncbi:hypothetical protein BJV78DRAFT_548988 [Lactifluus subvellereus]|nr:hypothetical protein BJV78DRAFT_548988 [Lactifluus subvellereus]